MNSFICVYLETNELSVLFIETWGNVELFRQIDTISDKISIYQLPRHHMHASQPFSIFHT
jgi:hypothetical protein